MDVEVFIEPVWKLDFGTVVLRVLLSCRKALAAFDCLIDSRSVVGGLMDHGMCCCLCLYLVGTSK